MVLTFISIGKTIKEYKKIFPLDNPLVLDFSVRPSELTPDTDLLVFTDSVFISNFSILSFNLNSRHAEIHAFGKKGFAKETFFMVWQIFTCLR